jgi:hypothetical protein
MNSSPTCKGLLLRYYPYTYHTHTHTHTEDCCFANPDPNPKPTISHFDFLAFPQSFNNPGATISSETYAQDFLHFSNNPPTVSWKKQLLQKAFLHSFNNPANVLLILDKLCRKFG